MTSSELWVNKYRPTTLDAIDGMEAQSILLKEQVNSFVEHKSLKRAFLLSGPPGTGKTTMVECLANEMGAAVHMVNASDSRSREDLKDVFSASQNTAISGRLKFIVLDEADGIIKSSLKRIIPDIEESLQPVFIICNDINKIPWELQQVCLRINFSYPSFSAIHSYMEKIIEEEGYKVGIGILDQIANSARSYRWTAGTLQNYCEFGCLPDDITGTPLEFTAQQEVELIFAGKSHGFSGEPRELIFWFVDSVPMYGLIETVDKMINRRMKGDYRSQKYAMAMLTRAQYPNAKPQLRTPTQLAKGKVRNESRDKRKKKAVAASNKGQVKKRTDKKLTLSKVQKKESDTSKLDDFF